MRAHLGDTAGIADHPGNANGSEASGIADGGSGFLFVKNATPVKGSERGVPTF